MLRKIITVQKKFRNWFCYVAHSTRNDEGWRLYGCTENSPEQFTIAKITRYSPRLCVLWTCRSMFMIFALVCKTFHFDLFKNKSFPINTHHSLIWLKQCQDNHHYGIMQIGRSSFLVWSTRILCTFKLRNRWILACFDFLFERPFH